jgi:hypothetical protein
MVQTTQPQNCVNCQYNVTRYKSLFQGGQSELTWNSGTNAEGGGRHYTRLQDFDTVSDVLLSLHFDAIELIRFCLVLQAIRGLKLLTQSVSSLFMVFLPPSLIIIFLESCRPSMLIFVKLLCSVAIKLFPTMCVCVVCVCVCRAAER